MYLIHGINVNYFQFSLTNELTKLTRAGNIIISLKLQYSVAYVRHKDSLLI